MSLKTKNNNLFKYEDTDNGDLRFLNNSMDVIDKGLVLNIGLSSGTSDDYILNLGNSLTADNKGAKYTFWCHRTSSGNYNITINSKYNLLDAKLKNIKKLLIGVPYTIIYDGGSNFFLASGSSLDDVTFTSDKLLTGYSANDSDGNKVDGIMANRGIYTKNTFSINEQLSLPMGFYGGINIGQNITTKASQTYTPSRSDQVIYANQYLNGNQTIKGDSNLLASNIKEGVSIFGVLGTCNIQSMGGVKMESGSSAISYSEYGSNPYYNAYLNINPSFTPKLVITYPNFDYNRCQTLFITNLFDKNKIYRQEWQGTSSDTTKRQIGASIIDYDASMMTNIYLGNLRQNNEKTVTWYAFG